MGWCICCWNVNTLFSSDEICVVSGDLLLDRSLVKGSKLGFYEKHENC